MRALRILALSALLTVAACQTTTSSGGVDPGQQNTMLQTEVTRRIAELRFHHGTDLLSSMTRLVEIGDAAAPGLRAGLVSDDWLTRSSIAWVMGQTADRRYIPDLRAQLTDRNPGVRYQVASALVELGDSAGFGVLVDGLVDGDIRNRYKCFESLKRATGQDFGYQHDGAPDSRRVAVARWLDWLEGMKAHAL